MTTLGARVRSNELLGSPFDVSIQATLLLCHASLYSPWLNCNAKRPNVVSGRVSVAPRDLRFQPHAETTQASLRGALPAFIQSTLSKPNARVPTIEFRWRGRCHTSRAGQSISPKRGEVYLVNFDPTVCTKIKKTRGGVQISRVTKNDFSICQILDSFINTIPIICPASRLKGWNSRRYGVLLIQIRRPSDASLR
jgi:hypothetical protein